MAKKLPFLSLALIAIMFLIIGFFIGKRYSKPDSQDLLNLALSQQKVLGSNLTVINSLNTQYSSCVDAFSEIKTCLVGNSCNVQATGEKLKMLEALRGTMEETISSESEKLLQIGNDFKSAVK
jgi:transposase